MLPPFRVRISPVWGGWRAFVDATRPGSPRAAVARPGRPPHGRSESPSAPVVERDDGGRTALHPDVGPTAGTTGGSEARLSSPGRPAPVSRENEGAAASRLHLRDRGECRNFVDTGDWCWGVLNPRRSASPLPGGWRQCGLVPGRRSRLQKEWSRAVGARPLRRPPSRTLEHRDAGGATPTETSLWSVDLAPEVAREAATGSGQKLIGGSRARGPSHHSQVRGGVRGRMSEHGAARAVGGASVLDVGGASGRDQHRRGREVRRGSDGVNA
jgi:hypothetical protein